MKSLLNRAWREDEGVLTFEWILLITLLTIGIVGGISAVRDAVITELGDVAQAMVALDQSYLILAPWEIAVADCDQDGAEGSRYDDTATIGEARGGINPQTFSACNPTETPPVGLGDSY